jgi:ECF transporter S component (folate family)
MNVKSPTRLSTGATHATKITDNITNTFGAFIRPPYERRLSSRYALLIRTLLAAFCVTMLVDALLGTYWVSILYGQPFIFHFPARLIKSSIMLPVHVVVFGAIWKSLGKYIESAVYPKMPASRGQ